MPLGSPFFSLVFLLFLFTTNKIEIIQYFDATPHPFAVWFVLFGGLNRAHRELIPLQTERKSPQTSHPLDRPPHCSKGYPLATG